MIAVTGAAGFIGSNLAHALAAEGHALLLVDHDITPAKAANLAGLSRFAFSRHDHFLDDLANGRARPEAIFHLGACSSTTETNWDYLLRNNVEYTRSLWRWCAANGVPLIYASSAATYGDGALGFDDRVPPSALTPLNLYGKSKNDFDIWALAEAAAGKPVPPKWAGLKFFNVYGPREPHKGRMASVVYQTWRQVKATGAMKLFRSTDPRFADGGQLRDFVFVGDCVNHMLWLWHHGPAGPRDLSPARPGFTAAAIELRDLSPARPGFTVAPSGLYNSGSGAPRTFLDLATAVFVALGLSPRISFIDMPTDLARQYQSFTCAEMSKIRAAGCEIPATVLEVGVRETVRWLEGEDAVRAAA